MAAVFLIMVCLLIIRVSGTGQFAQAVIDEVIENHLKSYPVVIASGRYDQVQAGLDRLSFSILPTRQDVLQEYVLLGGRYCSIQGHLAAQLKVRRADSQRVDTLYVVPRSGELADIAACVAYDDRVRIEQWQENDRLFLLASTL